MRKLNWLVLGLSVGLLSQGPQAPAALADTDLFSGPATETNVDKSAGVEHNDYSNQTPDNSQAGNGSQPGDGSQREDSSRGQDGSGQNYSQDDADPDRAQADRGDYPHITELENAILHKTYLTDTIEDRLSRLETTAFGAPSKNPDLSARTDALDNYADKKLHIKPAQKLEEQQEQTYKAMGMSGETVDDGGGGSGSSGTAGGANNLRKYGTMVGTGLLNLAGLGLPGFGGVRVRNRADLPPDDPANQQAQQPAPPPDDPAIYQKDPPPDGAKFLTKVAWCEVQVFGTTTPSMHLTKRLEQLNEALKFAPGKTGITLMDDGPAMIKAALAVQKRNAPAQNSLAGGAPGGAPGANPAAPPPVAPGAAPPVAPPAKRPQ